MKVVISKYPVLHFGGFMPRPATLAILELHIFGKEIGLWSWEVDE